jgi:hypothetical protein
VDWWISYKDCPELGRADFVVDEIDCVELAEKIEENEAWVGTTDCDDDHHCTVTFQDITRLELDGYQDVDILFDLDDGDRQIADCSDGTTPLICNFTSRSDVDVVEYYIRIGGCEEYFGEFDFTKLGGNPHGQKFNLAPESVDCCEITDVTRVRMEVTNKFILKFDVECDEPWPLASGECIPGKTYIGADQDIFWADVECCLDDSMDDLLHCESGHVDQKVSWTKVELNNGECEWVSPKFFTPAYQPDKRAPASEESSGSSSGCPSGQSMCGGSCCPDGACSDGECYS